MLMIGFVMIESEKSERILIGVRLNLAIIVE
jgi:hypothetical protein